MSALTQALILLIISSLLSFLYRPAETNLLLIAWIACHSHSWSLTRCTRCPSPSPTTTSAASGKSGSRSGSSASFSGSRLTPATALAARSAAIPLFVRLIGLAEDDCAGSSELLWEVFCCPTLVEQGCESSDERCLHCV